MSSGKGGGGGMSAGQGMKMPPQAQLRTSGWPNMGYQQVPQTFNQQGRPPWMQGVFANPMWGRNAATGQQIPGNPSMGMGQGMPQGGQMIQSGPMQMPQGGPGMGGGQGIEQLMQQIQQMRQAQQQMRQYGNGTNFAGPGMGWDEWRRDQEAKRQMMNNSGFGSGNLFG